MSDGRVRWTMSLRPRDSQLIDFFDNIEDGDRSSECRNLMLDGLKYRALMEQGQTMEHPNTTTIPPEIPPTAVSTPRTKQKKASLSKVLNDRLNKMLDNF
jgi:hypothetical protein